MSYAVIQLGGKQFKVAQGDTMIVDRLEAESDKNIEISDVLLTNIDGKVAVGTPTVSGAKVVLKVVSHQSGPKLRVAKYKAKSRYRKVHGHRQAETTVEVVSIL